MLTKLRVRVHLAAADARDHLRGLGRRARAARLAFRRPDRVLDEGMQAALWAENQKGYTQGLAEASRAFGHGVRRA